jgi:hypothetical protein
MRARGVRLALRLGAVGLLGVLVGPIRLLGAQEPVGARSPGAQDSVRLRMAVPCEGKRVSNIVVLTQPPYTDRLPKSLDFVRRGMVVLHENTKDEVIRRFLLLEVGDACTAIARTESERILRVQPFLVDAKIRAYDDGAGGVELEVETRDEFSVVAGARIVGEAPRFRGLALGESNLMGQGVYAAMQWREGLAYDDLIGFRLVDHQLLGQRNIGRIFATRMQRGHEFGVEALRPYYTDLQQFAWHGGYGGTREYIRFVRPDDGGAGIALRRTYGDAGGVFRVGEPGRLRLVGASITRERDVVDSRPVLITPDGFVDDPLADGFPGTYRTSNVARVNALLGLRRLSFLRVEGFDALTGVQDMSVGVQSTFMLGRSLPVFGATDQDWFMRHGLYLGGGSARSFVGVETITEARRGDSGTWDGIVSNGRLAWYFKPWRNQLTLTALDWAAGFNVRVPYQLSFAEREGGVLGYGNSRLGGARRAVLRVEQRWLPTPRTTIGDLGLAFFADVGRIWAGDVPFGETSSIRGTLGVGVLAAVPRRSRRLFRLDVGVPVGGDPNASLEVRITANDFTRVFSREARDIDRARERSLPRSLFTWP